MVLGGHDLDWEVGKVYSEQVAFNLSTGVKGIGPIKLPSLCGPA